MKKETVLLILTVVLLTTTIIFFSLYLVYKNEVFVVIATIAPVLSTVSELFRNYYSSKRTQMQILDIKSQIVVLSSKEYDAIPHEEKSTNGKIYFITR